MRIVLQRVLSASVTVAGETVGSIGPGLLVLFGVARNDSERDAISLAEKTLALRIFDDEAGKMNHSLIDIRAELLVVSQFTLYGDTSRGRRPGFDKAAPPELAEHLYHVYLQRLRESGLKVETGRFRTSMQVALINDGPVTFICESNNEG
jgi:D-aminoacyl-tRNA deacylase